MPKFWMVYRLAGSTKAKSRVPRFRHPTLEAAKAEADRLANLNPGVAFAVLETVDLAWANPPQKEAPAS